MTKPTQFLDLDSIAAELPTVVIKLGGKEHPLTPISVADWITNTKAIQALHVAETDLEIEVDAMIAMITRSFKTLTKDMLKALPLASLNKILEFAKNNNGEAVANKEVAAEAAANPPVSGA